MYACKQTYIHIHIINKEIYIYIYIYAQIDLLYLFYVCTAILVQLHPQETNIAALGFQFWICPLGGLSSRV